MLKPYTKEAIKKRGPRSNQKLKLIYLMKIFMDNTDEKNDITLQEIIDKLTLYNVTAERKSLYDDIEQLRMFGLNIEKVQYGKTFHYKVTNRDFKLAELKLLVDSVQSAKFITEEKSNELIKKIEQLACRHEAGQLQRQVYVSGRVKSMNGAILEIVDAIHKAIASDVKITFQYFQWNVKKEMQLRRDGSRYEISPWGLLLDAENYYMVGFDTKADKIKHFRVDKMLNIQVTAKKREGRTRFDKINMAEYAKKMFGMFDAKEQNVEIICENSLAGVMIDRFGKDIRMLKVDDEHFKLYVKVAVSMQFLGWIIALGKEAKIVGPKPVLEQINVEIDRLIEQYKN